MTHQSIDIVIVAQREIYFQLINENSPFVSYHD